MFVVTDAGLATLFCVITMLGWGSWANTQKLAGKDKWAFPLYYWDYAIAVLLLGVILAATLGSAGSAGMSAAENVRQAGTGQMLRAVWSGVLFNVSNILLVYAIDAAGMAVAFPIGVGLALVIGTVASYVLAPRGNPALLFTGVGLVVFAIVMSALAYSKLPRIAGRSWAKGVAAAVLAGCLMGFFYPQLAASMSPAFQSTPIRAGFLTPYVALVFFGVGHLASNLVLNTVFMRAGGLSYGDYFRGTPRLHLLGLLGGIIWTVALAANVIASGVVGPAIAYALGQGATLVAAIWGVAIWREFRGAPGGAGRLIALMFAGYSCGLVLVGMATQ
ncbi:MAG: multidrug DMT transporter permease [Bryobacterales bacterium]|nr:multidrug DMT transporter permease [Bryobacterales bacterium]